MLDKKAIIGIIGMAVAVAGGVILAAHVQKSLAKKEAEA